MFEHEFSQLEQLIRYKGTECDSQALQTLKAAILAKQSNNKKIMPCSDCVRLQSCRERFHCDIYVPKV